MKILETYVRLCYDDSMITFRKDLIKKIKSDILLIGFILITALGIWLFSYFKKNDTSESEVVVILDGNQIGRYSLSENNTITIREADKNYNLILINESTVKVTDANCPDKLCVRQKSISKNGESIICLPHKLVITIDSPEESDIDSVTK